MQFSRNAPALNGAYQELHTHNLAAGSTYSEQQLAFARYVDRQQLVVVSHFNPQQGVEFTLQLPASLISAWQLADGTYQLQDQLSGQQNQLQVSNGLGQIPVQLAPLGSVVYQLVR